MFIHTGRNMDVAIERRTPLDPTTGATAAGVLEAVIAKDVDSAVARTAGIIAAGEVDTLRRALEDMALDDPVVRPIVLTHVIKTAFAAFEEHEALAGHPDSDVPLLATVRFLASPVQERRIRPTVHTSIGWVVDRIVPRKLTQ